MEQELDDLDEGLRQNLRRSPVWREKDDLLRTVPGVGEQLSLTLLAYLPELGTLDLRDNLSDADYSRALAPLTSLTTYDGVTLSTVNPPRNLRWAAQRLTDTMPGNPAPHAAAYVITLDWDAPAGESGVKYRVRKATFHPDWEASAAPYTIADNLGASIYIDDSDRELTIFHEDEPQYIYYVSAVKNGRESTPAVITVNGVKPPLVADGPPAPRLYVNQIRRTIQTGQFSPIIRWNLELGPAPQRDRLQDPVEGAFRRIVENDRRRHRRRRQLRERLGDQERQDEPGEVLPPPPPLRVSPVLPGTRPQRQRTEPLVDGLDGRVPVGPSSESNLT